MDRTELLLVVSLLITVLIVIFAGLIVAAGTVQASFANLGLFFYNSPPKGILNFMMGSMLFTSMLGPPLSWGASVLGLFNSNWWMNTYMVWYLLMTLL
ncbi:MAG: hypothetical protein ACUVXA_01875 [Candidatus Jordarchaeum sp.]|uniref:hypothetical protein n=1 Tax=Candidatus Jordarchaeum sp. TaxID=2823881 RepID=UPI00404A1211